MKKQSAGILLYKKINESVAVLLVHPGGPFWAKKDLGAWSIPKGEFGAQEDPRTAAYREFGEELGVAVPDGMEHDIGSVKQSSKEVFAWAVEGELDTEQVASNTFEMEWPPRSGATKEFPEVDKAAWLPLAVARHKIVKGQIPLLERLADYLKLTIPDVTQEELQQEINSAITKITRQKTPVETIHQDQASLF